MKRRELRQLIREEVQRLNEVSIKPNKSFIKKWSKEVVNPGKSYNVYDGKAPKDWDDDDFVSWVKGNMEGGHTISDRAVLAVSGLPKGVNIIDLLNDNGSGLNGNKYFKKYDNWRSALYDIWQEIQKKIIK